MVDLSAPEIKPGEKYPWTYPEREGQTGIFGPASMATYLGWTSSALATALIIMNATFGFKFGGTPQEKLIFGLAAAGFTAVMVLLPVNIPYLSQRPKGKDLATRFLVALLVIASIASTWFVIERYDPNLIPSLDGMFHGKQNPPRETPRSSEPNYEVPIGNALYNMEKTQGRYDYVKRWCDGDFLGFHSDPKACLDLPEVERKLAIARRDLAHIRHVKGIDTADTLSGPRHLRPSDYRHMLLAILALLVIENGVPLLLYVTPEARKNMMLERWDKPTENVSDGLDPAQKIDHFSHWAKDCVEFDPTAPGVAPADAWLSFQQWAEKNDYGCSPIGQKLFEQKFASKYGKHYKRGTAGAILYERLKLRG